MKYFLVLCLLFASTVCRAQDEEALAVSYCNALTANKASIPSELVSFLGNWDSCILASYEANEFGPHALIEVEWENVKLSVRQLPPETSVYTVETSGKSPLTAEWYAQNQENLIDEFFDMNWDYDAFPGPSSEQYLSPEVGTNAQFWVERDKEGNVTWMKFSYAL